MPNKVDFHTTTPIARLAVEVGGGRVSKADVQMIFSGWAEPNKSICRPGQAVPGLSSTPPNFAYWIFLFCISSQCLLGETKCRIRGLNQYVKNDSPDYFHP